MQSAISTSELKGPAVLQAILSFSFVSAAQTSLVNATIDASKTGAPTPYAPSNSAYGRAFCIQCRHLVESAAGP